MNIWMNFTVWVAALGYFVDMFDITLFGVVRTASLQALGITDPQELLSQGIHLYNMQMIGMMIGGVLWGVLADKKGRLYVMFGSILLYSLGNIANAFVPTVEAYAWCRLITGIGLAGELGAAITIVTESLPVGQRGVGTTIVATMGLLGSVTAAFLGQYLSWSHAYILGGVMGLLLLVGRFKMSESGLFTNASHDEGVVRGSLRMLFTKKMFPRYLRCILVGVPIYFMTGILFTFSPEITQALGVEGVTAGNALLYGSIGLTIGDLLSGVMSQFLKSRKKSITISLSLAALAVAVYLGVPGHTATGIYVLCFFLGTFAGYWAMLVTVAAEQFGTNIRGTVATTVPNFVRGSAVFVTLGFASLKPQFGAPTSVVIVAAICFGLAALSLWKLEETFHKDLNWVEKG